MMSQSIASVVEKAALPASLSPAINKLKSRGYSIRESRLPIVNSWLKAGCRCAHASCPKLSSLLNLKHLRRQHDILQLIEVGIVRFSATKLGYLAEKRKKESHLSRIPRLQYNNYKN